MADGMRTQKYRSLYKWNMQVCNGPDCDASRTWPVLAPCEVVPEAVRPLSGALTWREGMFARVPDQVTAELVWDRPERYDRRVCAQYGVVAPSYWLDESMPLPMVQWNVYRGRAIARHWQMLGAMTIPTADWLGEDTYDLTLGGLPEGGVIAVDATGKDAGTFRDGLTELVRRVHPQTVMVFGPHWEADADCDLWWEHGEVESEEPTRWVKYSPRSR